MDWTSLIGPVVVAAAISCLGLWITNSRRFTVDRELAERKINADIDLAKQKLRFDKELTEHRVRLEMALAEKKFAFDKALIAWRRRYELAEQVLAAAYEARDAINWAFVRGIYSEEGKTRVATEPESQDVKQARDLAFVPIERLQSHSKAFVTLQTLQDSTVAHFGHAAAKPISDIFAVYHRIRSAAVTLIQTAEWNEERQARVGLQPIRDELWGEKADQAIAKVASAIEQLESQLRPILSASAPT